MLEMKPVERRIALSLGHLRTCRGEAGIQPRVFRFRRCAVDGAAPAAGVVFLEESPALYREGDGVNEPRFATEATD